MPPHTPIYDPPLTGEQSLWDHRIATFTGTDQELFLHVGHFVGWFACVEFMLTLLLHTFSGRIHPRQFHVLSKGMDARVKIERLRKMVELANWTIEEPLLARLTHFEQFMVPLRNDLVHSHLYWPEDADLQITTVGTPPIYGDEGPRFDAPPPRMISGLELFERGTWLKLFSQDIGQVFNGIVRPLTEPAVLRTDRYLSAMPKGYRPKSAQQSHLSKSGKRAQKRRENQQLKK